MAHGEAPRSESHICILANHAVAGNGLRHCLSQGCGTSAFVQATSIREALRRMRELPVWLAVVHIDGGQRSALEAVVRLKTRDAGIKVLVFIGRQELRCAAQLRQLRPEGYVSKMSEVAEIVLAAQALRVGRNWCSAGLAQFVPDACVPVDPHHHLTPREFLIFVELARGLLPARIGAMLSLGPARIAQYRARVFKKLQATSDAALTQYALRHDLID